METIGPAQTWFRNTDVAEAIDKAVAFLKDTISANWDYEQL